jgi:aspartate/methionine/tyrosine aminotransferase
VASGDITWHFTNWVDDWSRWFSVLHFLAMNFRRMAIEIESPEELGYSTIQNNLSESSVSDLKLSDLGLDLQELLLSYPAHRGLPELRELIATEGKGVQPEHVLITAGAAGALFLIAASLLKPGDGIVVAKPNYSTNLETPRALGANVVELPLRFEHGYQVELQAVEKRLTSGPKLLSLTVPHNPTGATMSLEELQAIIRVVESRGALLIFDETYREMAFGKVLPPLASLSESVISVSSLSKAYGLPGIRIGWLLCRNAKLMELFLAAKEQVSICTSIVDEQIALKCLQQKEPIRGRAKERTKKNFAALREWMAKQSYLEWVEPSGGAVCFPRIRQDAEINLERFYSVLLDDRHTAVGPGHWFDEDRRHFRIGFGYPGEEEFLRGLGAIEKAAEAAGT